MSFTITLIQSSVKKYGNKHYDKYLCFCGNEFIALRYNIGKRTKSCGCIRRKMIVEKNTTHGLRAANQRLYIIWKSMRSRCYNTLNSGYKNYGAQGVTVCNEWNDYSVFYKWAITMGYNDELTIDRINPFGNYEPSNCRWATKTIQAQNKRDTLGWDVVNEIRQRYNNGERLKSLSARFNTCRSSIMRILNNKTYYNPNFQRNRKGKSKFVTVAI